MKTRFFTHVSGFGDDTAHIGISPSGAATIVDVRGKRTAMTVTGFTLADCESRVRRGVWKEIPNPAKKKSKTVWTYSRMRATLKKNGRAFAIVTPDGSNALSLEDEKTLLDLLNRGAK